MSDLYDETLNHIRSITPEQHESEYLRVHAALRELFIKAQIPEQLPEDFQRLLSAYALMIYSSYMFPGTMMMPVMLPSAFDEFINILHTAYAIGHREGYSERSLELLLGLD